MFDKEVLVQRWHDEYAQKGIPSSFREEPSGSVVEFVDFLRAKGINGGSALDLGCGTGRNSLYLATGGFDVHSIDFVPEMIDRLTSSAKLLGLEDRVHAHCQSVTDPWPLDEGTFDVAIDAFCYKHQISATGKATYRQELARVMKRGGYYMLTLAHVEDGYYGPLLASSPRPEDRVIVDPVIQIPSILYTREDIEQEFGGDFELVHYVDKQRDGVMHGKVYSRRTLLFIFSRR